MIAVLFAIALATLAGAAFTRLIARDLHPAAYLGASILVGCGYIVLAMFFVSALNVLWLRSVIVIALLAPLPLLYVGPAAARPERTGGRPFFLVVDGIILLLIIGHAIFATWAPMYEWDWFGIWGLKARWFFDYRGIDWRFLRTTLSHPDYPLLAPLLIDLPSMLRKTWDDQFAGMMYTALCAGFIFVARGLLAEEFESELMGSIATLAITCPALNLWLGLGEGPVMAYGCAGLLLVRRGLKRMSNSSIHLGAILLGLAGWSKNEGVALTAMAIFAVIVVSWTRAWRMWPAIAIASVWMITRALLHLPTDFMEGDVISRVMFQLRRFGFFLHALFVYAPDLRLFWIGCFATIIIFARQAWIRERFLTIALVAQAFLMAAQALATRADIRAHIEFAWNRLPHQIAPAFGFLAVVLLMPIMRSTKSWGRLQPAVHPLRRAS